MGGENFQIPYTEIAKIALKILKIQSHFLEKKSYFQGFLGFLGSNLPILGFSGFSGFSGSARHPVIVSIFDDIHFYLFVVGAF